MLKGHKERNYCMVKKLMFQKWILVVFVVNRLAVTLFWFIKCQRWVYCLCSDQARYVSLLSCQVIVCRTCLGRDGSVKKKVKF